jgi:hypothetical protein
VREILGEVAQAGSLRYQRFGDDSCDFVDRIILPGKTSDPRIHTKQHERKSELTSASVPLP